MLNPFSSIKIIPFPFIRSKEQRRTSQKEVLKKAKVYNFGEQDQIDLISYSGLEESSNYLQMGDKFVRTLFISGFPFTANTGWLNMLINFNHNTNISYHIEQIDGHISIPKLNRNIKDINTTK